MLKPAVFAFTILCGGHAWAQAPLIAETVFVAEPAETDASSFGIVGFEGQDVGGLAALVDGPEGTPQIQVLGCRLDVQFERNDRTLSRVSDVFSKKLTSIRIANPPSAGQGYLTNPRPVGILDPVTSVGCSDALHYSVFLYRQGASSRSPVIEARVLEFDEEGQTALEADRFFVESDRPSVQARNAVRATRGFYRIGFRSEDSLSELDEQQQALLRGLLFVGPKLLGMPLP